MKVVLSALVVLSGLTAPASYAAPRQPTPKVLPNPTRPGFPGPGAAQRGSIGGPVSNVSGVTGTGIRKPH